MIHVNAGPPHLTRADFEPHDLLALVDGLRAVVWELDSASRRFTFVSDYAETLLGRPLSAWVDFDAWAAMIHPEDRATATSFCTEQTVAGLDHDFDYRAVRADGGTVWIRELVRLMRDADGRVTHLRGVMLDVTEAKSAEHGLRDLAGQQEALARIMLAVAENRDADEVFAIVADATSQALGADVGAVVEFAGDDLALRGLAHVHDLAVGDHLPTQVVGALDDVRRTGRAQRMAPAELAADDAIGRAVRREGIVSLAVVPVRVAGELWGCLGVANRDSDLPSDAEERLDRFADAAATAISHADARARLVQQANTDALTGLANHRSFQEHLREEVARAHRYGRPLSPVLIDLDAFKLVNDAHGHAAGDRALAEVARRLKSLARPGDVLARIGGDEFGWVLAETDALQAYAAAERARALIAGTPLLDEIVGDASAGVCGLEETEDPDELTRLADGALYWAKTHGRGVTFRYTPQVVHELSAAERAERLARQRTLAGLRALARAVDAKDHSTREHSERVADLADLIAGELGFDDAMRVDLREAALLHDVGKIGVPDAVLFKPSALSDDEFEVVKAHAALGATIAAEVLSARQVAWVRSHHERWAGAGYPDELSGDAIPVGGRILALADAWDVMVNVRTYKPAVPPEQAIDECRRCAGTQFWPEAVDALARVFASGRLMGHPAERAPIA